MTTTKTVSIDAFLDDYTYHGDDDYKELHPNRDTVMRCCKAVLNTEGKLQLHAIAGHCLLCGHAANLRRVLEDDDAWLAEMARLKMPRDVLRVALICSDDAHVHDDEPECILDVLPD